MATKMYNTHINTIFENCREYKILDVYMILVDMASELKENKFIIQTYDDSMPHLVNLVRNRIDASYKTVMGCIEKLKIIKILEFDYNLNGWIFLGMEYMTKKKDEVSAEERHLCTGYTPMHKLFFTPEFYGMRSMEKRVILYMAQLSSSKAGAVYGDTFTANLNKRGKSWLKVLRTDDKYYARKIITAMTEKYNELIKICEDAKETLSIVPKKIAGFIMKFKCQKISSDKMTEDEMAESTFKANGAEYALIMDKLRFFDITLTKKKIMHLIRAVAGLKEWFLKERVVQVIINKYIAIQKYQSREDIKSLPAYAAAVVKTVVSEYNSYLETISRRNFLKYELGAAFDDYMEEMNIEIESKEIENMIPVFEA